ncbi:MAG TPA: hypothetical protein PK317_00115 [Coprothermobacter proteolyticus]|mgnify:FL=1|nr:hypothetical protein [Coprothermobacter proteolyticus]
MLDPKVFASGLAVFASIYEKFERITTDKMLSQQWYRLLQDLSNEQFTYAVEMLAKLSKFPPTIAEIREKANELKNNDLQAEDAWMLVYQDVRRRGWYNEPTYPNWKVEAAKNAIGWSNLCDMSVEQTGVFRAQFIAIYNSLQNREKKAEVTGDKNLRELLDKLKTELAPGSKKELPGHTEVM